MRETAVSQRYARALLEAAESQKTLDRVSRDVAGVIDLMDASEDLRRLLESPMVHPKAKRDALTALFSGKVAPLTLPDYGKSVDMLFEEVVVLKQREKALVEALRAVADLANVAANTALAAYDEAHKEEGR